MIYAQVIVRSRTNVEELTYAVPVHIIPYIKPGRRVLVPLRKKSVDGVVVSLKTRVDPKLQNKIREIEKISKKGEGFSENQIKVIQTLAKNTGASLGEVASLALKLPKIVQEPVASEEKPQTIVWQSTWNERLKFYVTLTKKHAKNHRLLFILPTIERALELTKILGEQALLVDDNLLNRRVLPEINQRIIIGTLSASFFPLEAGDYLIIDEANHFALRHQSRPYFAVKTIAEVRSLVEKLNLIYGQTLINVADILKVKNGYWQLFNKLKPKFELVVANRAGSKEVLNQSIQERIEGAVKGDGALIFSAYKGESMKAIGSLLSKYSPVEVSANTASKPVGKLVLATEKIFSYQLGHFQLIVLNDVERFLNSTDPNAPWRLLEIIFELGAVSNELIVNTRDPEHWVFRAVKSGLGRFYQHELVERKKYGLPPFGNEYRLIGVADTEEKLIEQSETVLTELDGFSWINQVGEFVTTDFSSQHVFGEANFYTTRALSGAQMSQIQGVIPPAWRLVTD